MSTVLVVPTDGLQLDHLAKALATWSKYGPEIDEFLVVGEVRQARQFAGMPPSEWVTYLEVPQHQRRGKRNQQRNLMTVLEKHWPTDTVFIWTHDDIFLTQEVTLDELRGMKHLALKPEPGPPRGPNAVKLANTRLRLMTEGLGDHNYELHLPLVIDPAEVSTYRELLQKVDDNHQFRTYVLNHLFPRPTDFVKDVKIFHETDPLPTHLCGIYSTGKKVGLIDD